MSDGGNTGIDGTVGSYFSYLLRMRSMYIGVGGAVSLFSMRCYLKKCCFGDSEHLLSGVV